MSNLVFYEGWTDTLRALSSIKNAQFAKDVAWEIINYGTKGEYCTDDQDIINFVQGMCSAQIQRSQKRYEACKANGSGGGRPKQYSDEDIISLHESGMSNRDIAENLGCSLKTVERDLKLYQCENEDDEI